MVVRVVDIEAIKNKVKGEGKEGKSSRKSELESRYGVMKDIPEQEVEEEESMVKAAETSKEPATDIVIKLERLDSRLSVLEDYKKDIDERIASIREEIGELRSTFLALDKRFSSLEFNAERAIKIVEEVEPERISAEFKKIDKQILEIKAELERLHTAIDSLRKEGSELRSILEKIKSIENVIDISRKIEEKLGRVDDAIVHADRTSAKVEVVFTELSEKLGEIERQKGKLARLDELTKELVKMLDEVSIKLTKLAEKAEVEKMLEETTKNLTLPVQQFNKLSQEISNINKKVETIDDITKRLLEVDRVIESFDKALNEIRDRTNFNQQQIEGLIQMQTKRIGEEAIAEIHTQLDNLKKMFETQNETIKKVENENLLNEQRIVKVSDAVKRLADALSERLADIDKARTKTELYFEILQITSILNYLTTPEEIHKYLTRTREIASKMKELGAWNENLQNFVSNIFSSLAEMWRAYEQYELSQIYKAEADAYSVQAQQEA